MRDPFARLFGKVKHSASSHSNRSRTKTVSITKNDLVEQFNKQNGKCYWLGVDLDMSLLYTSYHPLCPSVDRLDCTKDYELDNIVISTRLANLGRGQCDPAVFKNIVAYLKERLHNDTPNVLKGVCDAREESGRYIQQVLPGVCW